MRPAVAIENAGVVHDGAVVLSDALLIEMGCICIGDLKAAREQIQKCLGHGTLNMEELSLDTIPEAIFTSPWALEIKKFRCGYNSLEVLPALGALPMLTSFSCAWNQHPDALPDLSACPNLMHINCDGNSLSSLSDLVRTFEKCAALETFSCDDNQITELPPEIGCCAALKTLSCANNRLVNLPPELGKCLALQNLYCYKNLLTALPSTLGDCSALEALICRHNKLTALPPELSRCAVLARLDVDGNPLEASRRVKAAR